MNFEEYTQNALKTESILSQDTEIDRIELIYQLSSVCNETERLDQLKKRIFYNKVCRTVTYRPDDTTKVDLRAVHGIIGIVTEAGGLAERLSRMLEADKVTGDDITNIREEIGDLFWYVALTLSALSFRFVDLLIQNNKKLEARYGAKFSAEKAINRNTDIEQEAVNENSSCV
jgi:NTP pyrophosphatase (non-canonical NTP hydrolase)